MTEISLIVTLNNKFTHSPKSQNQYRAEYLQVFVSAVSDHSDLVQSSEYLRQMIFKLIDSIISLDLNDQLSV